MSPAHRAAVLATAALAAGCLFSRPERAKMCRSVAAYPLACPPDRVRARIYKPTDSFGHGGQEVRSMCVADQDGRQVMCTETDGVWQCSVVFEAPR